MFCSKFRPRKGALGKVGQILLGHHMSHCVSAVFENGDADKQNNTSKSYWMSSIDTGMGNAYDVFRQRRLAHLVGDGPVALAGHGDCRLHPRGHPKKLHQTFVSRNRRHCESRALWRSHASVLLQCDSSRTGFAERRRISRLVSKDLSSLHASNWGGFHFGRRFILGWPFALFKVVMAGVMGFFGGLWAERIPVEPNRSFEETGHQHESKGAPLKAALEHAIDILRPIWGWLVVGILISAAIETFIPKNQIPFSTGWGLFGAYVGALIFSLPLYVCATASVPIAAALVSAGLPSGAALVFSWQARPPMRQR